MTEEQTAALADVRAVFHGRRVDNVATVDGGLWVTVREVAIGTEWNYQTIDLAVRLHLTYPTTVPYPFYCQPGLARTDGRSFSATQATNVDIGDGVPRTQISLRITTQEQFDTRCETLGGRFLAVISWLRNPR
jgi:hypothetical protein